MIAIEKKRKNEFQIEYQKECGSIELYSLNKIFMNNIINDKNTILILELYPCHYECTPGFSKYFIDLGYNVDIIMNQMGESTFRFFKDFQKIRIFFYNNILEIQKKAYNLSVVFSNYKFILYETTELNKFELYQTLNELNINKSIFVFHHIDYVNSIFFKNKLNKYQILSLGNFSIGTQVNPHYFGFFKPKTKNRVTKFFITSTIKRNYHFLVSAANKLKNENVKFHVNVIGKSKTFNKSMIPENIINDFTFKYGISYSELYKEVYNCDFIIINLIPNNQEDLKFKKIRVTGSVQLAYGFLKPTLINKDFAGFYNFNNTNSINLNFTKAMRDAINMKSRQYRKMKENLSLLSKEIYINNHRNKLI